MLLVSGNVFSSMEGISFDWSLISDTDVDQESIVDAHNILRYHHLVIYWSLSCLEFICHSFCYYTFCHIKCTFVLFRILKYSESNYETPRHVEMLEREGKQGLTILVEGIRTGSAKVSAKLSDPVYKVVKSCANFGWSNTFVAFFFFFFLFFFSFFFLLWIFFKMRLISPLQHCRILDHQWWGWSS